MVRQVKLRRMATAFIAPEEEVVEKSLALAGCGQRP